MSAYASVDELIQSGAVKPYSDWIFPANPAAGATASYSVPGQSWVRVCAARASITTDGNAANRLVSLDFITARSKTVVRNAAPAFVTASQTGQQFEWSRQLTVANWQSGTPAFVPVLDQWLPPGFTVQFSVDSIQVGDQLSGLSLYVEKYDTGFPGGGGDAFNPQPPR